MSKSALHRLTTSQTPLLRRSNPHSQRGLITRSPSAVSLYGALSRRSFNRRQGGASFSFVSFFVPPEARFFRSRRHAQELSRLGRRTNLPACSAFGRPHLAPS